MPLSTTVWTDEAQQAREQESKGKEGENRKAGKKGVCGRRERERERGERTEIYLETEQERKIAYFPYCSFFFFFNVEGLAEETEGSQPQEGSNKPVKPMRSREFVGSSEEEEDDDDDGAIDGEPDGRCLSGQVSQSEH